MSELISLILVIGLCLFAGRYIQLKTMDEFIRKAGKMEVRSEKMISLLSQINGIILESKNEIECADGVVSLAHEISELLGENKCKNL